MSKIEQTMNTILSAVFLLWVVFIIYVYWVSDSVGEVSAGITVFATLVNILVGVLVYKTLSFISKTFFSLFNNSKKDSHSADD